MSECDLDPPCTSVEKDMQKTIDMHADRVMQLTEILTAALPALRHCYKQATWLPMRDGTHPRFHSSGEELCNYTLYKEALEALGFDS